MKTNTVHDSLASFVERLRVIWSDGTDRVLPMRAQRLMEELLKEAQPTEPWLRELLNTKAAKLEIYRDPDKGFILMGHVLERRHDRPPHDHGSHWVLYGVYSGAVEITKWCRTDEGVTPGRATLDVEEVVVLKAGSVRPYQQGEIHSVKKADEAPESDVVFRFLSGDLDRTGQQRYDPMTNTVVFEARK